MCEITDNSLYLVYWEGDGGDRESYSVFYQRLIKGKSDREAKIKYMLISEYGVDGYINLSEEEIEEFINSLTESDFKNIDFIKLKDMKLYT